MPRSSIRSFARMLACSPALPAVLLGKGPNNPSKLLPGEMLNHHEFLVAPSRSGVVAYVNQEHGWFEIYIKSEYRRRWETPTDSTQALANLRASGRGVELFLAMSTDGALRLYWKNLGPGNNFPMVVWTNPGPHVPGSFLILDDNANLVIRDPSDNERILWMAP